MSGVRRSNESLVAELRGLVAEEMFLLGQELDDTLNGEERRRLTELTKLLDEADTLLELHRTAARRP